MDYLFMIELNGQTVFTLDGQPAGLTELKQKIRGLIDPSNMMYLERDDMEGGLVGIVRFDEKASTDPADFFDSIRALVADINDLPKAKAESGSLDPTDGPEKPATWARAPMQDILFGFGPEGSPDPNSDQNPYQIVKQMLKGGIGGKH